jgi:hypothetical protein
MDSKQLGKYFTMARDWETIDASAVLEFKKYLCGAIPVLNTVAPSDLRVMCQRETVMGRILDVYIVSTALPRELHYYIMEDDGLMQSMEELCDCCFPANGGNSASHDTEERTVTTNFPDHVSSE